MEVVLWIWFASALSIVLGAIFYAGYNHDTIYDPMDQIIGPAMGLALFAPLLLIILPFVGLYELGKYLRTKKAWFNDANRTTSQD